jgi:hypothetical protein
VRRTDLRLSPFATEIALDALTALLGGGSLEIYGGSRPSSPEAETTWQPMLVRLRLGRPAFEPSLDGVAKAFPIEAKPVLKSGEAVWARLATAEGDVVCDLTVGQSHADLVLDRVDFQREWICHVEGLTVTWPMRS